MDLHHQRITAVNRCSIGNAQIFILTSQNICIYDTFVPVNTSVASSGELHSQPAVIALHNSTLNLSGCTFTRNKIPAIRAIASNITLSGNLSFSNNSAYGGTAFILVEDSILILAENCQAHFINNHATNTGGVIFISNTRKFISTENCSTVNGRQYCIFQWKESMEDYIVFLFQLQHQLAFFKLKHKSLTH